MTRKEDAMIAINNISQDLHARFDGAVATHVIDAVFEATLQEHLGRATVNHWVPLLAGRAAAEELALIANGTLDAAKYGEKLIAA